VEEGITACQWRPLSEALELLSYDNARGVLKRAGEMVRTLVAVGAGRGGADRATEGPRERGHQGTRERGNEGTREGRNEGTRGPGNEGTREGESEETAGRENEGTREQVTAEPPFPHSAP
jgi:hypothetical protein